MINIIMIIFKIFKIIQQDVLRLVTSGGQRKILSSYKEWNLKPSDSALRCCTTEPQRLYGERRPLWSSYVTRVLHTSRISDVDSAMSINIYSYPIQNNVAKSVGKLVERQVPRSLDHNWAFYFKVICFDATSTLTLNPISNTFDHNSNYTYY